MVVLKRCDQWPDVQLVASDKRCSSGVCAGNSAV